ncbi:MAG: protein kinase, partial [Planctomycetes bacterium]|nr:protein kinase [Planctomycetota bacterium]
MSVCRSCHTPCADDAAVCPACGADLPSVSDLLYEAAVAARSPATLSDGETVPPRGGFEGRGAGDGPEPAPSGDATLSAEKTVIEDSAPTKKRDTSARAIAGEIDRYEMIEEIGRGGMGAVYRARDRRLSREVAIKRLLRGDAASAQGIERFLREARAIAALNHPNIVTVYDVGKDARGYFIVMELVDGRALADIVREKGPMPPGDALPVIRGVAAALEYAHKRKVVHRDIKPGNVMLARDGAVKVLDFGLARFGPAADLSVTGVGMGTMDYAAPEQWKDARRVDHRADIYSLGATMYALLTGESPHAIRPGRLPKGFDAVVLKCVEDRPEARYFSIADFLADLTTAETRLKPAAAPSGVGAAPAADTDVGARWVRLREEHDAAVTMPEETFDQKVAKWRRLEPLAQQAADLFATHKSHPATLGMWDSAPWKKWPEDAARRAAELRRMVLLNYEKAETEEQTVAAGERFLSLFPDDERAASVRAKVSLCVAHRDDAMSTLRDVARSPAERIEAGEAFLEQWPNHEWAGDAAILVAALKKSENDAASLLAGTFGWTKVSKARAFLSANPNHPSAGAIQARLDALEKGNRSPPPLGTGEPAAAWRQAASLFFLGALG